MSYHALLQVLYQVLIILGGLLVASWGAMVISTNALRVAGCVIAAAAGIWAAWQGVDQAYLVLHAFGLEYLKLFQVLAAGIGGAMVGLIVYFSTGRPVDEIEIEVEKTPTVAQQPDSELEEAHV